MKLLGVDVGYSEKRKSTGVAYLDGSDLTLHVVGTPPAEREHSAPSGFKADVIAIDGPLLPDGANAKIKRACERILSFAPFQKRCKAIFSHFGSGLRLREAARDCSIQFSQILKSKVGPESQGRIRRNGPVVEAFPNAFLGVLLDDNEYRGMPKLRRGEKFDWLYKQMAQSGRLEAVFSQTLQLPSEVWRRVKTEEHHDKRAALICLLTAALVFAKLAEPVGDDASGWISLPPLSCWRPWAREGLDVARRRLEV